VFRGHCDHATPARVRRLLGAALDGRPAELVDGLRLAVTELATNAVQAGATILDVSLLTEPMFLELRVADDAPGLPRQRDPDPTDERGRGLQILDRLADAWGYAPLAAGKTVWARFLVR
jgi:anti-sigma regulatory factor (Ser/Thr protein kinase)